MIRARIEAQRREANLRCYDKAYKAFCWSEEEKSFSWRQTGRMNIVHEAVDRWLEDSAAADRNALIFENAGHVKTYSFADLKRISCQWANLLVQYGYQTGDRLFIFLPLSPAIYFAILACARMGVVFCPLFPTLSFDELEDRLKSARPRGVLTHPDLAERLPHEAMKDVEHVFLTRGPLPRIFPGEILLGEMVDKMDTDFATRWLPGDTPLYLLFTSGSTGPPKGVVHAQYDMVGHLVTARYVLDLREGDVLWTDSVPAWVTGAVYGLFAPWLCGATSVVQADPFSASTWYRTLERHQVTVWYQTPGTMRLLKEAGEDLVHRYDLSHLRHIATVGEALIPELIYWFKKNFKLCPHDTWWMTETGMICVANFPSMDIKPGSMGKPVPGIQAAVIDDNGNPLPPLSMGELALRPGWPSMMIDIWQDRVRYQEYFRLKGWFATGDVVLQDEDGYFYHQGRTDYLIKVGVKLIGPYEIERELCRHPAVSEAAVIFIGAPAGTPLLKAFVTIKEGRMPSTRLNQEIQAFLKANLSSEISIAEIAFLKELPKTRSGKLLRRALRAQEMGLPIGDPSKIED